MNRGAQHPASLRAHRSAHAKSARFRPTHSGSVVVFDPIPGNEKSTAQYHCEAYYGAIFCKASGKNNIKLSDGPVSCNTPDSHRKNLEIRELDPSRFLCLRGEIPADKGKSSNFSTRVFSLCILLSSFRVNWA